MSNARDKANIPSLNFSSTGIDDNATSTAITIDSSERVGINTTSQGSLYGGANNLVVGGGSANAGMSIYTGTSNVGRLFFADGTSGSARYSGFLEYNHSNDGLQIGVNGSTKIKVDSSGNVGIGNTNPADFSGAGGQNLVVGSGSGAEGMTIYSGTTSDGVLGFADGYSGTEDYRGFLIYKHNGDAFQFGTSSSERMRLNSTGLGIGTTSPTDILDIRKSTSTSYDASSVQSGGARLSIFNTNNTLSDTFADIHFKCHSTSSGEARIGMELTSVSNSDLFFITENSSTLSEKMRIKNNGNVGIGTTSPDSILDLTSTPNNNFIHFNATTGGSNGDIIGGFEVNNTGGTIGKLTVNRETTSSSGYMAFQTGTSEKMRIQNNGNVGIGTSSPSQLLHIENGDVLIKETGTSDPLLKFSTTSQEWIFRIDNSDSDKFQMRDATGANTIFTADTSGNLGIGTTSPTQKLDVNGTVKATAFQGDGSALTGISSGAGTIEAFVNFNGTGSVSIRRSGNVSSITDHGTGNYTVNFTSGLSSNYAWSVGANVAVGSYTGYPVLQTNSSGVPTSMSSTAFRLYTNESSNGVAKDVHYVCLTFIG